MANNSSDAKPRAARANGAVEGEEAEAHRGLRATNESMRYADEDLTELEMPEDLQKVFFYALDEAAAKIEAREELVPFTVTVAGDDLFVEMHAAAEVEDSYASAATAVNTIAHLASAYVFCYDGFIETDEGASDMIIAEVGEKGSASADVFGLRYEVDEESGAVVFEEALVALGEAESLFSPEASDPEASDPEASGDPDPAGRP